MPRETANFGKVNGKIDTKRICIRQGLLVFDFAHVRGHASKDGAVGGCRLSKAGEQTAGSRSSCRCHAPSAPKRRWGRLLVVTAIGVASPGGPCPPRPPQHSPRPSSTSKGTKGGIQETAPRSCRGG